ncbi:MAG: EamA family transporter [Actinomycetota bacterium]|nr:EamA family transporter [Actinomycetota bacterium]
MSRQSSTASALLVLGGAALFGTVGTARVLGPAMQSAVAGAARLIVAAALLLLAAAVVGRRGDLRRLVGEGGAVRWIVFAGVGQAGFQVSFLAAVELIGVATGTLVAIGCTPLVAGLMSLQVSRSWLLATGCALCGLVLLVGGSDEDLRPLGLLAALGASLSYAVYIAASHRVAMAGVSTLTGLAAIFALAAVLLSPALVLLDTGGLWSATGLTTVVYLAVVPTVVAYAAFNLGLRSVAPATAATFGLIEPVVAAALGIVVLGERLGPTGFVGAALVMAGLTVLVEAQRRRATHPVTSRAG